MGIVRLLLLLPSILLLAGCQRCGMVDETRMTDQADQDLSDRRRQEPRPDPSTRGQASRRRVDDLLAALVTETGWRDAALALSKEEEELPYIVERINALLWISMSERRHYNMDLALCRADPNCRIRLAAIAFSRDLKEKAAGLAGALFELAHRREHELKNSSWDPVVANLGDSAVPFCTAKIAGGVESERMLALNILREMGRRFKKGASSKPAVIASALTDPIPSVRAYAVKTLGSIAPTDLEVIALLDKLSASDKSEKVRRAARSTLDEIDRRPQAVR